jgi:hypothetical protein
MAANHFTCLTRFGLLHLLHNWPQCRVSLYPSIPKSIPNDVDLSRYTIVGRISSTVRQNLLAYSPSRWRRIWKFVMDSILERPNACAFIANQGNAKGGTGKNLLYLLFSSHREPNGDNLLHLLRKTGFLATHP